MPRLVEPLRILYSKYGKGFPAAFSNLFIRLNLSVHPLAQKGVTVLIIFACVLRIPIVPTPVIFLTQRYDNVELSGVLILFAVNPLFCAHGVVQPVPYTALYVVVPLVRVTLTTPYDASLLKYLVVVLSQALISLLPSFGMRISNTSPPRPPPVIND